MGQAQASVAEDVSAGTDLSARSEAAISVHALSKRFALRDQPHSSVREQVLHPLSRSRPDEFHALSDVSFAVPRGACVGVVGRNGSGKSTLLRCIAGIYPPSAGRVEVHGRLASFIELGVGFDRELSARDNLITNGMLFGLSAREVRRQVGAILSYADLESLEDVRLKKFSSGMLARLGFALTTHVNADILLFDEVIATGDLAFQRKCFARFEQSKAEGRTIVLVTHDMNAVQSYCDRAVLIERGAVVLDGDPTEVAERYDAINLGDDAVSQVRRSQRQRQRALEESPPPPRGTQPVRAARSELRNSSSMLRIALRLAMVEYKRKYADAVFGYVWAVLRPLVIFAVLDIVFTRVAHFDSGVHHYPLYLLTMLVLWTFFLDSTTTATYSLVSSVDLLLKMPLPRLAIPLSVVIRAGLDLGMNLIAVAIFVAAARITPTIQWLELPVLIIALALVATGISLLTSVLYVRLRDVGELWATAAQVLFWGSPILYVASSIPSGLRPVLMLSNPLAGVFTQMRHVLIDPSAPTAAAAAGGGIRLLIPCVLVLMLLALGILVFRRQAPLAAESL